MRTSFPAFVASLAVLVLLGSGCAMSDLKNTNRRLKEANDGLVSENNRLEQELASVEKDASEKAKRIDELTAEAEKGRQVAELPAEKPSRKDGLAGLDDFPGDDAGSIPGVSRVTTSEGIRLRLDDKVFFAQGQATLSPKGQSILKRLAQQLNTSYRSNMIRVDGHTDDVPVSKVKNKYPSNWELSTARACAVVRYLQETGNVRPTRIYAAGFAGYKPATTGRTPAARSQNRRVEIVILKTSAPAARTATASKPAPRPAAKTTVSRR